MLSQGRRIHRSGDFDAAVRRGRRVRRGLLVAHVVASDSPTRCGFIVSKAVGNSVVRHRVTRQLRHLCHDTYAALPADSVVVLRALPGTASAPFSQLKADFEKITSSLSRAQ